MHQQLISAPQQPYALISAYSLQSTDRKEICCVLRAIKQTFARTILHFSKTLHEIITSEQCFDVPQFPRIRGINSAQADLLVLIYLDAPQSTERIQLKRITNGYLSLMDQKLCYLSDTDPTGAQFYKPKPTAQFETENGGTYCFYLRFSADPISWQYLEADEQNRISQTRAERWSNLVNYRLLTFDYFDSQNGFVLMGYAQSLVQFEEFFRKVMGFNDEFSDEFITEYCILQGQGCFYCLPEDYSFGEENSAPNKHFTVSRRARWPKRDDEEEEPEEEKEEKSEAEKAEESKEEQEEREEVSENEKPLSERSHAPSNQDLSDDGDNENQPEQIENESVNNEDEGGLQIEDDGPDEDNNLEESQ